ncbi:hypothetical protein IWW50_005663 [Coemansia erecta]|nr:hypothetical protein GGF43_004161 [Coemansia sp. RSA 2618]KAJ2818874.1 hypothetical protein IWW50_005663 [Coemansia erecta]
MFSSARSFSKQVLNHRTQIQQQTKSQLRNQQHNNPRAKDQPRHDDDLKPQTTQTLVAEKMREENRERKKRWRELNEERNKDNDLRCRVNKRANQLYGATASEDKERWIGEEFERRQQKRREKELRKRQQSVDMPVGFGSYAELPPHQVRAANDFWRSMVASSALESDAHRVQLPPLRSVVPEALRNPGPRPASMNVTNAPLPHVTELGPSSAAGRSRHVRPWEEDRVYAYEPQPQQPDVGLSEAAFSLMSLSSSADGHLVT